MQRLQAFKFQLRPNGAQELDMRRFAGTCRFVYIEALALQKARHERGERKLDYAGLCKRLTEWRSHAEKRWLRDAPTHPLQLRLSRAVLGALRNVTVSLRAGKWHVSILTEREVVPPVAQVTRAIGIDVGIARFATFSDGSSLAPLNSFKRHEIRLRHAQRALSRKVKFSHNWRKAKARVQRIHVRIGNARCDYLHKATSAISKNHTMVCIEDLRVKNLSRSASGTAENPGRNVRAKEDVKMDAS